MISLLKNWAFLLTSNVGQSLISFFVFIILARVLSPEGYGTFSTLLALTSLVAVFVNNLSANLVITREITLNPETTAGILRFVYPIRTISFLIAVVVLVSYLRLGGEYQAPVIIASVVIVGALVLWDLIESVAFGHFVTIYTTIISLAASSVWLVFVMLMPHKFLNLTTSLWLYAFIFSIRAIIYFVLGYKKFIRSKTSIPFIRLKNILLMSGPYFWMRIIGAFTDQLPILLLNNQLGAIEVGYFAVGNKLIMPITLTVTTAMRAAFPFMTKLYKENIGKFNSGIVKGFSYVLIIASSVAAMLSITSELWIPTVFGDAYLNSIEVFKYQAWFGALLSFDLMLSTILSSTYRQKVLAIVTTIDVLIVFPLIWFGIKYGAEGMAIAKLSGVLITTAFHILVLAKTLKVNMFSKKFLFAALYFLSMLIISIVDFPMQYKLLLVVIVIIINLIPKESSLREIYTLTVKTLKTKGLKK